MSEYKDFVQSTGYGTGGGLCGWNCRHNFIPFDPELMENNLDKYGMAENKEQYLNEQKQRYFERNIRKYKRLAETEKTALNAITDKNTAIPIRNNYLRHKKLATKWNKAYKQFSEEHDMKTEPERLKISKVK
jgi:hypothetical protein